MRFRAFLNPIRFTWIHFSNLFLLIITLGFYMPWAKVRLYRYKCSCVELISDVSLDCIAGEDSENVSALGDSASERLDFGFGF